MTSRLNPYLSFAGDQAKEAMEFYADVFGGDLTLNTFGQYGDPDADGADRIMHAQLQTPLGFTLMGADTAPGMGDPSPGDQITISLSGDDRDELRGYFERLGDGGTVVMPLEKQMWGDEFGMVKDKYGIDWMVDIAPE